MNALNEINQKKVGMFYFKAGSLLFWGVWFAVAFLGNVFDFAYMWRLLPDDWHFRSGNYTMLVGVLSIYGSPTFFVNLLFISDCIVQVIAALFFCYAFFLYISRQNAWKWINWAFIISIGLWAAFLIMEEIFIAYGFATVQRQLFSLELLSWMSLLFFPEERSQLT